MSSCRSDARAVRHSSAERKRDLHEGPVLRDTQGAGFRAGGGGSAACAAAASRPQIVAEAQIAQHVAIESSDEWLVGRSCISQGSMATLYETRTDRSLSSRTDEEVAELAAA